VSLLDRRNQARPVTAPRAFENVELERLSKSLSARAVPREEFERAFRRQPEDIKVVVQSG
jgi:hypothetical protein